MPSHDKKTKRKPWEEIYYANKAAREAAQKADTLTIPQPDAGIPSKGNLKPWEEIYYANKAAREAGRATPTPPTPGPTGTAPPTTLPFDPNIDPTVMPPLPQSEELSPFMRGVQDTGEQIVPPRGFARTPGGVFSEAMKLWNPIEEAWARGAEINAAANRMQGRHLASLINPDVAVTKEEREEFDRLVDIPLDLSKAWEERPVSEQLLFSISNPANIVPFPTSRIKTAARTANIGRASNTLLQRDIGGPLLRLITRGRYGTNKLPELTPRGVTVLEQLQDIKSKRPLSDLEARRLTLLEDAVQGVQIPPESLTQAPVSPGVGTVIDEPSQAILDRLERARLGAVDDVPEVLDQAPVSPGVVDDPPLPPTAPSPAPRPRTTQELLDLGGYRPREPGAPPTDPAMIDAGLSIAAEARRDASQMHQIAGELDETLDEDIIARFWIDDIEDRLNVDLPRLANSDDIDRVAASRFLREEAEKVERAVPGRLAALADDDIARSEEAIQKALAEFGSETPGSTRAETIPELGPRPSALTEPGAGQQADIGVGPDEIRARERTARPLPRTLVGNWVIENVAPGAKILDFGAGSGLQSRRLLGVQEYAPGGKWDKFAPEQPFTDVHSYDTRSPSPDKPYNDPLLLQDKYDVVMASNVLNVQATDLALKNTLEELASLIDDTGRIVVNFPTTPRKNRGSMPVRGPSAQREWLTEIIGRYFNKIEPVRDNRFILSKPKVGTGPRPSTIPQAVPDASVAPTAPSSTGAVPPQVRGVPDQAIADELEQARQVLDEAQATLDGLTASRGSRIDFGTENRRIYEERQAERRSRGERFVSQAHQTDNARAALRAAKANLKAIESEAIEREAAVRLRGDLIEQVEDVGRVSVNPASIDAQYTKFPEHRRASVKEALENATALQHNQANQLFNASKEMTNIGLPLEAEKLYDSAWRTYGIEPPPRGSYEQFADDIRLRAELQTMGAPEKDISNIIDHRLVNKINDIDTRPPYVSRDYPSTQGALNLPQVPLLPEPPIPNRPLIKAVVLTVDQKRWLRRFNQIDVGPGSIESLDAKLMYNPTARVSGTANERTLATGRSPQPPGGTVPPDDIDMFEQGGFPGAPFGRTKLENLARIAKVPLHVVGELASAMRTMKFSFDYGFHFRQGAALTASQPRVFFNTMKPGLKAMFTNERTAKILEAEELSDPNVQRLINAGMFWAERGLSDVGQRIVRAAETYTSPTIEKIPLLGRGIKASERGFTVVSNLMRARAGKAILERWEAIDPTRGGIGGAIGRATDRAFGVKNAGMPATPSELKGLASLLNYATGRGDLPGSRNQIGILLNRIFAAPRLQTSRVQFVAMVAHPNPRVRKEAARMLVSWTLLYGAILGFLGTQVSQVRVETNSNSSDFGKIRYGRNRIDVSAGYLPLIRYASQIISNRTYNSDTGETTRKNPTDQGLRSRIITMFDLLRSKLNPPVSLPVDNISGTNILGEEVDTSPMGMLKQVPGAFLPISPESLFEGLEVDIKEAFDLVQGDVKFDNAGRRLRQGALSLLDVIGAGTSVYPTPTELGREAGIKGPLDPWEIRAYRRIIDEKSDRPDSRIATLYQEKIKLFEEILTNTAIVRTPGEQVQAYHNANRNSSAALGEAYFNIFGEGIDPDKDPNDEPDANRRALLEYRQRQRGLETEAGDFDFKRWSEAKMDFFEDKKRSYDEKEYVLANTNLDSADVTKEMRALLSRTESGRKSVKWMEASEKMRRRRGERSGSTGALK
jgi:hypothetical protein